MASPKMTPTMRKALRVLAADRTGEGVIARGGNLLVNGAMATHEFTLYGVPATRPFSAATWLRLASVGYIEPAGRLRFRITDAGRAAVKKD